MQPTNSQSLSSTRRGRVVYIAGVGRSGSTLLGELLGKVPGLEHFGELRFLFSRGIVDNDLCGCGVPFAECEFWGQISERLILERPAGDVDHTLSRVSRIRTGLGLLVLPKYLLAWIASQGGLAEVGHAYSEIQRACEGCTIVDSSKSVPYLILLLLMADNEVSVVHIVRDPRSVAMSRSRSRTRVEVTDGHVLMTRQSAISSAVSWVLGNGLMELTRVRFGIPYFRVRYEDVIVDPDAVVHEITQFLGVGAMVGGIVSKSGTVSLPTSHTVAGNPMRFHSGEIEVQRDVAWRANLSRAQAVTVSAITIPLMIVYGYAWRRSSRIPR